MKIGKSKSKGIAGYDPPRKKGDPTPPGHGVGRVTTYRPEYCDAIIEYFSRVPWELNVDARGSAKVIPKDRMPTFIRWCQEMGVSYQAMLKWCRANPEFKEAHDVCKELQMAFLVEAGGITVNGGFAMFLLKCNHGMQEPKAESPEQSIAEQLSNLIGKLPS